MITEPYWACSVHAPRSSPRERLATAMDMARMRLPEPLRTVVVRPETAAELGKVETIEIVSRVMACIARCS